MRTPGSHEFPVGGLTLSWSAKTQSRTGHEIRSRYMSARGHARDASHASCRETLQRGAGLQKLMLLLLLLLCLPRHVMHVSA